MNATAPRGLLLGQGRLIREALPGVIAGSPLALHDLRVAIRRFRTLLKVFRAPLAGTSAAVLAQRLGRLSGTLSGYRDTDTRLRVITSAPMRRLLAGSPGWAAFLDGQRALHRASKRRLAALMRGDAARVLIEGVDRFIEAEPAALDGMDDAAVRQVALKALRKATRRVEERARIPGSLPAGPAHELRIACRRARYLAEFFAEAAGEPVAALGRRMKRLQDILGDLHDTDVQLQHLGAWRGAPAALLRELKARRRAHASKFRLAWAGYARSRVRREARALLDA